MKKIIIFGIIATLLFSVIVLAQIEIMPINEEQIVKIDRVTLSRTNQTKIEDNYRHPINDMGTPIDYQIAGNLTIINFDSGWRVFTSTDKFNKIVR